MAEFVHIWPKDGFKTHFFRVYQYITISTWSL